MILKCYSFYKESFIPQKDISEDAMMRIVVMNKLIRTMFDRKGIVWPMKESKFNPSLFDDIFDVIPSVTFEIVFYKDYNSTSPVKVVYYQKNSIKQEFSSTQKGRESLFSLNPNTNIMDVRHIVV